MKKIGLTFILLLKLGLICKTQTLRYLTLIVDMEIGKTQVLLLRLQTK